MDERMKKLRYQLSLSILYEYRNQTAFNYPMGSLLLQAFGKHIFDGFDLSSFTIDFLHNVTSPKFPFCDQIRQPFAKGILGRRADGIVAKIDFQERI